MHAHIIRRESPAPPLYLVVLLDETYDITEIREFHLDAAASTYRLYAIYRSILDLEQPVWANFPSVVTTSDDFPSLLTISLSDSPDLSPRN